MDFKTILTVIGGWIYNFLCNSVYHH